MGLERLFNDPTCVFAYPRGNEPLQEARDFHTVVGAPTVEAGPWGPGLLFDGATDHVIVNAAWEDSLRFNSGAQDFSIVAWIRLDSFGAQQTVICKLDGAADGWCLFIVAIVGTVGFGVNNIYPLAASGITDLNWHMVAATIDRSGNAIVYLDGVPGTPMAIGGEVMTTTSLPYIAARSYDLANKVDGAIAGIGILNRILSPEEVLGLSTGKAY